MSKLTSYIRNALYIDIFSLFDKSIKNRAKWKTEMHHTPTLVDNAMHLS